MACHTGTLKCTQGLADLHMRKPGLNGTRQVQNTKARSPRGPPPTSRCCQNQHSCPFLGSWCSYCCNSGQLASQDPREEHNCETLVMPVASQDHSASLVKGGKGPPHHHGSFVKLLEGWDRDGQRL